jgi:hypothetical protein
MKWLFETVWRVTGDDGEVKTHKHVTVITAPDQIQAFRRYCMIPLIQNINYDQLDHVKMSID